MRVVESLTRDICPRGDDTNACRRLRLCFRPGGQVCAAGAAGQARLATQSVCILNDAQRSAEGLGNWLSPLGRTRDGLGVRGGKRRSPERQSSFLAPLKSVNGSRLQEDDCGDYSPEAEADCRVQAFNDLRGRR